MGKDLSHGKLVGFGNPLLDISAHVDTKFLEKYGLKSNDAILATEKHMEIFQELVKNYKVEYIAGGSVQNTLRVCQWIINRPCTAVFFGGVGKDKYADIIEEKARIDGVDTLYQVNDKAPTGTCAVLITGNDRSLVANLAAANFFTEDHLKIPENDEVLKNAEYIYISGFFISVSPPSIRRAAKIAVEGNRFFMMNLSAVFVLDLYKDFIMEIFPYVDTLFGNREEMLAFSEHIGKWDTKDVIKIAQNMVKYEKVNKKRKRLIVITQGYDPVLVVQEDSVKEYDVPRATLIVDTNGAGDAFVGGFLSQFVNRKGLKACLHCGVWAASKIIQTHGCTFDGPADYVPLDESKQ
ncbi:adenosine kinase isoform X2 [Teleopsis dalmanni]|uniref:adenosine kinase isoform X2 n=1 Tax=Teleopsis dalmanni TaxID=139649 RepID=UPI0018CD921A|nr:adenosine kinase isoform X2 [Teleopsis dalmanni]